MGIGAVRLQNNITRVEIRSSGPFSCCCASCHQQRAWCPRCASIAFVRQSSGASSSCSSSSSSADPVVVFIMSDLASVDFEIFGHVQGYEGKRLGLVGWVKNTHSGTVVGQVQGPLNQVEEMKVWLSKEGSPSSRITRASFSNQRSIEKLELKGFSTRF
uniref:Acylphosphatase-like domain-containing protein n=1 Tax=Periophthalmus magnuspinnatus TaxID=409849 RepID=A0A3B4B0H8_9GOBI